MTVGTVYRLLIDNSIEEGTMMEHQQKSVFLLFLGIVFLCIPAYTFSIPFPETLYYYMNAIQFAALVVFTTLYSTKKININTAFSSILIVIHIETCIEIIYCSIYNDYSFQRLLIMGNMVMSILYIMIAICAYIIKYPSSYPY